jgi:Xaa-Pro aminopeptidase
MARKKADPQVKRYAKRRQAVLREANKTGRVDALLISKPTDVRYLSGLVEGSQNLLIGKNWGALFTHRMFRDRAPLECPGLDIQIPDKDMLGAMRTYLLDKKVKTLGFQKNVITVETCETTRKKLRGIKMKPLAEFVSRVRAVKDEEEIRLTTKAIRIAERAFKDLTAGGAASLIGKTELQIANELEYRMRELGALCQAFPGGMIVAAGSHSSACHHIPTSRKVKDGDVVLFDWGAEVAGGYRSDQTRTLFMRKVPSRLEPIYPIVQEAVQRALDAVRPGATGPGIDRAARGYITEEGFGHEFRHGLGHGVGLDIHEPPFLSRNEFQMKKNMIITIEPGIYFIGYGGIRLEEMVLITGDGCKVMDTLPLGLKHAVLK